MVQGEIDPERLFGAALVDLEKSFDVGRWLNEEAFARARQAAHEHAGRVHDASNVSLMLAFDEPVD